MVNVGNSIVCGNLDKRNMTLLLLGKENDLNFDEYYELKPNICVYKCPVNYTLLSFCATDDDLKFILKYHNVWKYNIIIFILFIICVIIIMVYINEYYCG